MPDGYTHDPESFRDEDDPDEGPTAADSTEAHPGSATDDQSAHPEAVSREFDWRGWTLVAGIVVAFLVVPGIIYLYPRVGPSFGLTFWDTYLVLPMVPAILLGLLAVWATTRP